ncbi:MAG: RNA-guided pseudouridylation complex pseudouridine synthase subunit Cbf5 [Candidatus Lokiarchaeota archaeon]|nr:RNA-guided pseudouridylation complex pseudouridine synthase subunit Cbf5 [Candidatus Lokiarchaeota archaeon]MBD3340249.1 RNA-guided pseudouridylation complex pseudouridine synthase subunit Cbf5 [Candidatus Lokiarchaeota archaeon]
MKENSNKLPSDESEQLLIKSQDTTDLNFGCKPNERDLDSLLEYGVINLDKPSGPTSHEVVSWTRNILGIKNIGHAGTLDPKVTGVLPCALGKATRVLSALLNAGKEYVGILRLHSIEPAKKIEAVLKIFMGKIYQRPPLKSSVARKLRIREIYYNDILEISERDILFRVGCEAGTYIRKLCFDIGEALCSGAHMLELRRTRVGRFKEDETLFTLQNLKDAFTIYQEEGDETYLKKMIMPMEKMVEHIPKIYIRDTAVDALCHGASLAAAGVVYIDARIAKGMRVAYMTLKKELIGFGTADKTAMEIFKAKSGLVAHTDKIFMKRGKYPHWKEKDTGDLLKN